MMPRSRHRRHRDAVDARVVMGLIALMTLLPLQLSAQRRTAASIQGRVVDIGGVPVPNARVLIADSKRRTASDEEGRFVLSALPAGDTLRIVVARIGFKPIMVPALLHEGMNDLVAELEPIPMQLNAVYTEAEQSGLFGVVGDTAFNVIAGARIALTAGRKQEAATNDLGQFAVDSVGKGPNFLQVTKPGYRPRLLSFSQPAKGGSKLAIWMKPLPADASKRDGELENRVHQALFDFRARTSFKSTKATIITRETLVKYGIGLTLGDALNRMPGSVTKNLRADGWVLVVDETEAPGMSLFDYFSDDVEMLELYPPCSDIASMMRTWNRSCRMNVQSMSLARGAGAGVVAPSDAVPVARIWLRR